MLTWEEKILSYRMRKFVGWIKVVSIGNNSELF
jgi:hypothetical protein